MTSKSITQVTPKNPHQHNGVVSKRKTPTKAGARKRTCKRTRPRRFALDIGKNISLALMAQKYDWDPRIDGDGGAE